jgi:hypothetical protein
MNGLIRFYNSVHLNWGIKKQLKRGRRWFDYRILYPIYSGLERYYFGRVMHLFGADYHWDDQKSQNLDKKTGNFGYGYLHYAFIRSQRPERILCLGSMYGFIPYMMAKACRDNGFGHVDFVDAGFDIEDAGNRSNHYYGQGFWKKIDPKAHFDYLGVGDYITPYIMLNSEFAKKYDYKYDYIYLDADHSYKGAILNLKLFWARLRQDGYLCFHDIHFDRVIEGVAFEHGKMWKRVSPMPFKFEVSNHYSGLGFLQKLDRHNPLDYCGK